MFRGFSTARWCVLILLSLHPAVVADDKKYLYLGDSVASAIVTEHTGKPGNDFFASKKPRLVEFYSPYCGHCQRFKKTYVSVATELRKKYEGTVDVFAVSCVAHHDVCQKFEIKSYPTVWAIRAGEGNGSEEKLGTAWFSIGKVEKSLQLGDKREEVSDDPDGVESEDLETTEARQLESEDLGDEEEADGYFREAEDLDEEDLLTGDEDMDERMSDDEQVERMSDDEQVEPFDGDSDKEQLGPLDGESDLLEPPPGEDLDRGALPDAEELEDEDDDEESVTEEDEDLDDSDEEIEDREFEQWSEKGATATRPRPGAATARIMPNEMDKWKEVQMQRLKGKRSSLLRRKPSTPAFLAEGDATKIMKANRPGTWEFNQRQKELLEDLDRIRRKKRGLWHGRKKPTRDIMPQKQFKKKVGGPRLVEKLPIVKRIHKMNEEEKLILDASLSLMEGLRYGVFKTKKGLDGKQKQALKAWLDLLSISLPPEWGIHSLIADLSSNINEVSQSNTNLQKVLNKHAFPRKRWSRSCSKTNGFTCGFWKLLHIVTVGVAVHRGGQNLVDSGLARPSTRVFSPMEAADTLRNYIEYFFLCGECSNHFLATYDQCDRNRRCSRLTDDSFTATDADWKEFAMWLWEFHNDVSVRLLNEQADATLKKRQRSMLYRTGAGPGAATLEEEVRALWPTIDGCIMCFNDDGSWNEEAIFLHLEKEYWPGHDLEDTPQRLVFFEGENPSESRLLMMMLVVGMIAVLTMGRGVSKSSVQQTMLKARTLGTRVAVGGKKRSA